MAVLMRHGASVVEVTGDTTVSSGPAVVYSVHVVFDGVTAGDTVVIKDGSTARKTFVAHATDADHQWISGAFGAKFAASVVVDVTLAGGGAVHVCLVYAN